MKIIGVIPARMGSSRYPGKPLAEICGLPMIEHVYRRSAQSDVLSGLYVATCDQEIVDAVNNFGGKSVMTSDNHERCTDRVAEAITKIGGDIDIVVNIQGDEPLIRPEMITAAVQPLLSDPKLETAHMVAEITGADEFNDPNEVKVVFDQNWNTLYCSREPIPSSRKGARNYKRWKQVCVIPFRKQFLMTFNSLPQTPLEMIESVDMMRAVEHGYKVRCVKSRFTTVSVDTKDDLLRAEQKMLEDPLFPYTR